MLEEQNNEDTLSTLDINVDDLFKDPEDLEPQDQEQDEQQPENDNIMTKAVSERINTVRRKTENETQEKIAKELGYQSYADLQKANEQKILKDAGLDEEELTSVVEQLVQKRLASDPRLKKLEEYEAIERNKFVESQLKEINKLAGSNYTSIQQLPKETLQVWEKTGDLKQAYLATQGEALLTKSHNNSKSGSLTHLANPGNSSLHTKSRPLTEEEKAIWRSVMPDITDEELSKKTIDAN